MPTLELNPSSNIAVHDQTITLVQGDAAVADYDDNVTLLEVGKAVAVSGEARIFTFASSRVHVADTPAEEPKPEPKKAPRKPRPSEVKAKKAAPKRKPATRKKK